MKKILFLASFLTSFCSLTFSQNTPSTISILSSAGVVKTTLTNTDTAFATLPEVKTLYDLLNVSIAVTKATGTLAGSALLQATLDGTKWFTVSTTTLANGSNDLLYVITGNGANRYRLQILSSGTSTATVSDAKFIFKKRS